MDRSGLFRDAELRQIADERRKTRRPAWHDRFNRLRGAGWVADQSQNEGASALRCRISTVQQRLDRGQCAVAVSADRQAKCQSAPALVTVQRRDRKSVIALRSGQISIEIPRQPAVQRNGQYRSSQPGSLVEIKNGSIGIAHMRHGRAEAGLGGRGVRVDLFGPAEKASGRLHVAQFKRRPARANQ